MKKLREIILENDLIDRHAKIGHAFYSGNTNTENIINPIYLQNCRKLGKSISTHHGWDVNTAAENSGSDNIHPKVQRHHTQMRVETNKMQMGHAAYTGEKDITHTKDTNYLRHMKSFGMMVRQYHSYDGLDKVAEEGKKSYDDSKLNVGVKLTKEQMKKSGI